MLGAEASALTHETEIRHLRKSEMPRVQADGDCTNLCIIDNKTNHWCYTSTPPMLQVGWDWSQTYAQTAATVPLKFLTVKLRPYVVMQGFL